MLRRVFRVISGVLAFVGGLIILGGIFVSKTVGADLNTAAMVFACVWLACFAITGKEPVGYLQSKLQRSGTDDAAPDDPDLKGNP